MLSENVEAEIIDFALPHCFDSCSLKTQVETTDTSKETGGAKILKYPILTPQAMVFHLTGHNALHHLVTSFDININYSSPSDGCWPDRFLGQL